MRTRLTMVLALVVLALTATTGRSQAGEAQNAPEIALEVYCYLENVDVPQPQAQAECSRLGEFGLTWEQTLDVLDASGAVLETVVPQVVTGGDNRAPYPADGAWIARAPVLPDGWAVIECPFGDASDDTVTNGAGQVLEAERLSYQDRRHVVCYQLSGAGQAPTPSPTPRPSDVPRPTRIDTGGGGTAGTPR